VNLRRRIITSEFHDMVRPTKLSSHSNGKQKISFENRGTGGCSPYNVDLAAKQALVKSFSFAR